MICSICKKCSFAFFKTFGGKTNTQGRQKEKVAEGVS